MKEDVVNLILRQMINLFLSAFLLTSLAYSKALPSGPEYQIMAKDEPITSVLKSFAGNLGIPIVLSDAIEGKVSGQFADAPRKFLDRLCRLYNLVWYFDGSSIYVYNGNEVTTKVIKVSHISTNELRSSLTRMGILDESSSWQSLPLQKVAYISGPPRFVEIVSEVAEVLDASAQREGSNAFAVEIFPLKYKLAYDKYYHSRGRQIVVKGVATILQEVLGSQAHQEGQPLSTKPKKMTPMPSVTPQQEKPIENPNENRSLNGYTNRTAKISANRSLNAVVISDLRDNMDIYAELIDKFDVPSEQVEINVSIIDVSTENLFELGIDLQGGGNDGSVSFGDPTAAINQGGGVQGSPQTVVIGQAKNFLGRVNMLSQDGNAKILSRPSVLTVDKTEAIIDNSSTFYVRVAAQEDAELYPVTVGTMMRVTPRIVTESEGRMVHLDIDIEDGNREGDQAVDNIPIVKKNTITTSAIVGEESSLLVGGYYYDRVAEGNSKVPVLGDIPILSLFFNWESSDVRRMVRLFLITPKVVSNESVRNGISPDDIAKSFSKLKADKWRYTHKKGLHQSGEQDQKNEVKP